MKGLIEGVSIFSFAEDIRQEAPGFISNTDASACEGMLQRTAVGKLKHLFTTQLWAQGAVATFQVRFQKVARSIHSADAFTYPLGQQVLQDHLRGFAGVRHSMGLGVLITTLINLTMRGSLGGLPFEARIRCREL